MQEKKPHQVNQFTSKLLALALYGLAALGAGHALGQPSTGGQRAAEATIDDDAQQAPAAAQPADFKNRLEQRRISDYASFDRALFDRSFDVGYTMNYNQRDAFFSERQVQQGVFVSTGIGQRTGLALSVDRSRLNYYDASGPRPEFLFRSKNSANKLSLNHLLLPETLMLPQLVGSLSVGNGRQDSLGLKTRGASLNTTRTLESASLFGTFQFEQSSLAGGNWQSSRSLGVSYFLTVNHRLAAGLGYQLTKPATGLSIPSVSTTLVYRLLPDWVLRGSVSQVSGANESSAIGVDVTYTFQP